MAKKPRIYLDTAAATPIAEEVRRAMLPHLTQIFGNPASLHQEGVLAARALSESRQDVARELGAQPDEIIFTSGGTESNALALSLAEGGEVLVSAIEHSSVLTASDTAVVIPVDSEGVIDLKKLQASLSPRTKLVSVMYANNEIGTIEPVKAVAKIIRDYRKANRSIFPYFHTDACQATRFLPLLIPSLGVDLLTLNAAKIYGPKGVGALYVRRGIKLAPLLKGGGQEDGRRSGTPNVAGIVGLASALTLASKKREAESKRMEKLKKFFITEISRFPEIKVNSLAKEQLPHLVNLSFSKMLAEQMVIELDARGIAVSTGSACAIASHDESYVIMALGKTKKEAEQSVRFSFDRQTSIKDLRYVIKMIKEIIEKYQKII